MFVCILLLECVQFTVTLFFPPDLFTTVNNYTLINLIKVLFLPRNVRLSVIMLPVLKQHARKGKEDNTTRNNSNKHRLDYLRPQSRLCYARIFARNSLFIIKVMRETGKHFVSSKCCKKKLIPIVVNNKKHET